MTTSHSDRRYGNSAKTPPRKTSAEILVDVAADAVDLLERLGPDDDRLAWAEGALTTLERLAGAELFPGKVPPESGAVAEKFLDLLAAADDIAATLIARHADAVDEDDLALAGAIRTAGRGAVVNVARLKAREAEQRAVADACRRFDEAIAHQLHAHDELQPAAGIVAEDVPQLRDRINAATTEAVQARRQKVPA